MTAPDHPLTRSTIVSAARGWIGTPYRHQASLKQCGCDCLGLVRGVWREVLGREPEAPGPYSADWAEAGKREHLLMAAARHLVPVPAGLAATGDVLLFRWRAHVPAKHAAIMSGPAAMIHAHEGACVCEVPLTRWWQRHIAGVFAFPGVRDFPGDNV